MLDVRRRIAAHFGGGAAAADPMPDIAVADVWFDQPVCRNCGVARATPFCGQCGQKAAPRLVWGDLRKEGWDRLRLFEFASVRTLWHLLTRPGTVAREYVMGRRTAHMHPLKLLVALIAILVLLLAANQYFGLTGRDAVIDRMTQRVMAYANWSFSLGIVAIFAGAWLTFRRRLGYNAIEIAVLPVYCQSIIVAVVLVNMLPTLIWRSPDFIAWHKAASQYYVPAIKLAIVALGYAQFFLIRLKVEWPKLLLACGLYAAFNWVLLRAYAWAILWLVSR